MFKQFFSTISYRRGMIKKRYPTMNTLQTIVIDGVRYPTTHFETYVVTMGDLDRGYVAYNSKHEFLLIDFNDQKVLYPNISEHVFQTAVGKYDPTEYLRNSLINKQFVIIKDEWI